MTRIAVRSLLGALTIVLFPTGLRAVLYGDTVGWIGMGIGVATFYSRRRFATQKMTPPSSKRVLSQMGLFSPFLGVALYQPLLFLYVFIFIYFAFSTLCNASFTNPNFLISSIVER